MTDRAARKAERWWRSSSAPYSKESYRNVSRSEKRRLNVPAGVEVTQSGQASSVKGGKGHSCLWTFIRPWKSSRKKTF